MDFTKYKFHCSSLPTLMVAPRNKSEVLSETAKGYLRELWIEEAFGRKKYDSVNKYTQKGLLVEQDSMDLVMQKLGNGFIYKNKTELENEYLVGCPDIVKPGLVDVKSSWDIWTFADVTADKAKKDYYYQLLGYMLLTNQSEGKLAYALSNTPDFIIERELMYLSKYLPDSELQIMEKNFVYDDIPNEQRVKIFDFQFEQEEADALVSKIMAAREYIGGLSL